MHLASGRFELQYLSILLKDRQEYQKVRWASLMCSSQERSLLNLMVPRENRLFPPCLESHIQFWCVRLLRMAWAITLHLQVHGILQQGHVHR